MKLVSPVPMLWFRSSHLIPLTRIRGNSWKTRYYHRCWCPSFSCPQDIDNHGACWICWINEFCLSACWVLISCAISQWRREGKRKYNFMFPLNNSARRAFICILVYFSYLLMAPNHSTANITGHNDTEMTPLERFVALKNDRYSEYLSPPRPRNSRFLCGYNYLWMP